MDPLSVRRLRCGHDPASSRRFPPRPDTFSLSALGTSVGHRPLRPCFEPWERTIPRSTLKSAPAAPTTGTSAGTLTQRWRRSPQNSATISPRHIATQITADDLAWADDVLVMDDENHQQLARRYPNLIQHIRLLDATAIPDLWLVRPRPGLRRLSRPHRAGRPDLPGQPPDKCRTALTLNRSGRPLSGSPLLPIEVRFPLLRIVEGSAGRTGPASVSPSWP
jgi:predicted protein tyrosine phosphatase